MAIEHSTARALVEAIRDSFAQETTDGRTLATVTKVDADGTVWARLAGSDTETPCTRVSSAVQPDDVVNVTVANGRATVDGNYTRPSTDDTMARKSLTIAESAIEDSQAARDAALSAIQDAGIAKTAANNAQASATQATGYANSALAQLSTVEDVVGTLNWITEHGTYSLTQDAEVDDSKVYYTRTGSGTAGDPYVYMMVDEPTDSELSTYYELTIDESVQNYIASHLAQTDYGLNLMVYGSDFRMHIGTVDGTQPMGSYVLGTDGVPVAQFTTDSAVIGKAVGEMHVELTPDKLAFVDPDGNETAYIAVDDTGFSVMYITRTMVAEDMRFGKGRWKWYSRANGNMSLKWMGA